MPAESAHGLEYDETGVREALYVSEREIKAWQVFRADSQAEVERIVEGFPSRGFAT